jgi:hypothetical protein
MLKASRAPLIKADGLYGGTIPSRAPTPEPTDGVVVVVRSVVDSVRREIAVHIANPSAELAHVTIELSGRYGGECTPSTLEKNTSQLIVTLPNGSYAGSTVHMVCTPV